MLSQAAKALGGRKFVQRRAVRAMVALHPSALVRLHRDLLPPFLPGGNATADVW